jgi:hypothetical protein
MQTKILNEKLGQSLTTKQVAEYFNLDEKTVRLQYKLLGGVRIGRSYRFFENKIVKEMEDADGILQQDQKKVCSICEENHWRSTEAERETVQNFTGSKIMGSRAVEIVRGRVSRLNDKHGLLPNGSRK